MEPTWDGIAHLPGNLGTLRIVRTAYPDALVSYVAGAAQIERLREIAPADVIEGVHFVAWEANQDRDTGPGDVLKSWRKLRALPASATRQADLIVMCSCTATMFTALAWSGLAARSMAMLHGNANDLAGWRSRQPLRRWFDLGSALPRFCGRGGRLLVMEQRIAEGLSKAYPWMAGSLHCLPHPLLPEESGLAAKSSPLSGIVQIAFAGLATVAKGFPQFVELQQALDAARPGQFAFHAVGKLHPECAPLDQSGLATRAAEGLPRREFVGLLSRMDYLFVWHQDNYYGHAASGVVYDAVNLGLPMVARTSAQISEWQQQGLPVALSFDTLAAAIAALRDLDVVAERKRYALQCRNLDALRDSLSLPRLAQQFQRIAEPMLPSAAAGHRHP